MELVVGKKYDVVVIKIVEKGVIVELEDKSTEFIHVSQLSNRYVSNIEDIIAIGDSKTASCIKGKVKSAELSFKESKVDHKPTKSYWLEPSARPDLDEMIEASNRHYQEKMSSKGRRNRKKSNGR